MMKLATLLLLILATTGAVGCTAQGGQNTAVSQIADPLDLSAAEEAAVSGDRQEPAEGLPTSTITPESPAPTEAAMPTSTPTPAPLPVISPAPGWDNETWINTDGPLLLEELRGKVVLLEFWTFG
jgi:hypothetical protein